MLYAFLAAAAPRDQSEWVGPGLLGFVVIAGIGLATVLLWRNMNKQLRKVRFEEQEPGQPGGGSKGPNDKGPDGPTGESTDGGSSDAAGRAGTRTATRGRSGAGSRRRTS